MSDKQFTIGSLFAGIGGFDLGFENAGFKTSWVCEFDEKCCDVLGYHFPDAKRYRDVRVVRGDCIEPVDVITFGSPCQDLSVAGKRRGLMKGRRSNLFFEATRIIDEMRKKTDGKYPRFALWENVPGALSSSKGEDFRAVLDEMAELGALGIGWRVLDSRYFGVPQRRRRVFLVSDFRGRCAEQILFEPESLQRSGKKGRKTYQEISGTLTASTGGGDSVALDTACSGGLQLAGSLCASHAFGRGDFLSTNHVFPDDVYKVFDGDPPPVYASSREGKLHMKISYGDTVYWAGFRTFTPVEESRLQGFPDDWSKGIPDEARYHQFGNAVCVPVAEWIAHRMMKVLLESE